MTARKPKLLAFPQPAPSVPAADSIQEGNVRMPKKLNLPQSPVPAPQPQAAPKAMLFAQTKLERPTPTTQAPKKLDMSQAPLPPRRPDGPTTVNIGQTVVPDLDLMLEEARQIDPRTAANKTFSARLRACAGSKVLDWMNWSNDRMEALRVASNAQVKISVMFNDLKVAEWCDQAREHASKKPGLLTFLRPNVTPEFYDAQLIRIRSELETIMNKAYEAIEVLKPKMEDLQVDSVIFQVVSKRNTDPMAQQIAHNKLTSILAGIQTGAMAEQALRTTLDMIVQNIQAIDQVRNNVIPAWRLAHSSR